MITPWDPPDWHAQAACRGHDQQIFFPPRGEAVVKLSTVAKAICAGCPVRTECLDYAVTNIEPFGIWGGMTERQRRALRRQAS